MPADGRGQWVVVIRDVPANEDRFVGPFTVEARADAAAARLTRDFATRGASDVMDAVVRWVRPGVEIEDVRDDLLAQLEEGGYGFVPLAVRQAPGFNPEIGF